MNSSNKMNNVLLVLLSASVIATIGTIFYHFVDTSYETETAIRATADESKYFEGVYVRDENVLSYSGTGAVSYQVPDGGKILLQKAVEVQDGDTPEILQRRVMEQAEWVLLPRAAELVSRRIQEEKENLK